MNRIVFNSLRAALPRNACGAFLSFSHVAVLAEGTPVAPLFEQTVLQRQGRGSGYENCLRSSTAAVATRLAQQTQFPLYPGTPFTLDGAVHANPLKLPRLIATPGTLSKVVFVNDEWSELFGSTTDQLRGHNAVNALTSAETDAYTRLKVREALEYQKRVHVYLMHYGKDDASLLLQLQLSPLLSKDGKVSHILASLIKI